MIKPNALYALMSVIHDRRANPPPKSYTTHLFAGGVTRIGGKVTEEASELVEAATAYESAPSDENKKHVVHEAADLVYHTLVMLSHCGLDLSDVERELAGRFGISGIDEKASRSIKHSPGED